MYFYSYSNGTAESYLSISCRLCYLWWLLGTTSTEKRAFKYTSSEPTSNSARITIEFKELSFSPGVLVMSLLNQNG